MSETYPAAAALGLMLAATFVVVAGMLGLGALLGPRKPTPGKLEPFECGAENVLPPPSRFSVKYYLVAILFLLFDVEIVFLYPWAVAFADLGVSGYAAMAFFVGLLAAGLAYVWKAGALEWD